MLRFPWILRAQGDDPPAPDAVPDQTEERQVEHQAPRTTVVSGVVATVNLVGGACTLVDGTVVRVGDHAAEAMAALRGAARVLLDAEGLLTEEEELIATEVWIRAE